MKRVYSGLDAIKVSLEGATLVTGQSACWEYVGNRVGVDFQCNTEDQGKVGTWEDLNDPNFPVLGLPGC